MEVMYTYLAILPNKRRGKEDLYQRGKGGKRAEIL